VALAEQSSKKHALTTLVAEGLGHSNGKGSKKHARKKHARIFWPLALYFGFMQPAQWMSAVYISHASKKIQDQREGNGHKPHLISFF
jgi:hypothetical protein